MIHLLNVSFFDKCMESKHFYQRNHGNGSQEFREEIPKQNRVVSYSLLTEIFTLLLYRIALMKIRKDVLKLFFL